MTGLLAQGLPPNDTSGVGGNIKVTNPALGEGLQGITGADFFGTLVPNLITLGFVIGAIVFFFMMIIGAIGWITAGGDKARLESSRSRVLNAIVGLVVLFALYAIISLIEGFFGITIKTLDISPLIIQ